MTNERPKVEGRPRILGIRPGVNPNSSSLGVDITFLLLGGTGSLALSFLMSAWLRGRKPAVVEVGAPKGEGQE